MGGACIKQTNIERDSIVADSSLEPESENICMRNKAMTVLNKIPFWMDTENAEGKWIEHLTHTR